MKMKKYLLSLLCLFLIFSGTHGYAQVTIGSQEDPRKGTILDIKQNDKSDHDPNAEGGIGLPRVALVSPTELTIDDDAKKSDYVGLTVYNITDDANIKEGTYFWDGNKWELSVSVDNYGSNGQLLQSKGDGTFRWSTFVVPEFQYHKPTQISILKSQNVARKSYSYAQLTGGGGGQWGTKPSGTFDYLYSDELNIQSDISTEKYLLIGIAGTVRTTTIGNAVPKVGYWQIIGIDIVLTDMNDQNEKLLQSNQRLYPTAAGSDLRSYVDLFTIVPITEVGAGTYKLKIKISNVENTFSKNCGVPGGSETWGYFDPATQSFYNINLADINFILYEDD